MERKYFKVICIFIISLLYVIYLYFCFARIVMGSDFANMILEANDIIHGNIFLSGWWLTGITFLTTDLLYFIIGTLVFGISQQSFVLAETIMFFVALLSATFLLNTSKDKIAKPYKALFLSCLLIPSTYWCIRSTVHMGYVGWGFLAIIFIVKSYDKTCKKKERLIIAMIALILAQIGDALATLTIVAPIILVAFIDGFREFRIEYSLEDISTDKLYLFFLGILSFLVSNVVDKLYIFIGGAERNSYIGKTIFNAFIPLSKLDSSLVNYFNSLVLLFGGCMTKDKIVCLNNVLFSIKCIIVLIGLILVMSNIVSYIRKIKIDFVSLILSIGFLFVSSICIITKLNEPRYYSYAPFVLSIVEIRYLCIRNKELAKKQVQN